MNSSLTQAKLEERYQGKIDELSALVQAKAIELSEVEGRITTAKSEVGAKQVELNSVKSQIAQKEGELAILESNVEGASAEIKSLSKSHAGMVENVERQIATLKLKKKEYESAILKASTQLSKLKKEIQAYKTELGKLQKDYADLVKITRLSLKTIEDAKKTNLLLDAKKKEVSDLVRQNGSILTETVKNLGTIEHYVKRLQRYYDKTGIKIDLLSQFNIKR